MTDRLELAERVEKAAGPDRELDWLIYEALNPPKAANAEPIKPRHRYLYGEPYTGSVDAAMSLVPPDRRVCDLTDFGDEWSLLLRHKTIKHAAANGDAKTAALAICAAALRASHSQSR